MTYDPAGNLPLDTYLMRERGLSAGQTIQFMPSARREVSAAERFFKKMMRADNRLLPFTVGADKHVTKQKVDISPECH